MTIENIGLVGREPDADRAIRDRAVRVVAAALPRRACRAISARALGVLVAALALIGFVTGMPSVLGRPPVPATGPTLVAEPPAAAAFMADYARGDEAGAERVATPLYRAEWARRGLTDDNRALLLPSPGPAGAWIRFVDLGGVVGPAGFGHRLYLGRPTAGDGPGASSVWRVDLAPDGRVIWIEMVWLFGDAGPVEAANVARDPLPAAYPPELAALHPRPLLGTRSTTTSEAYFLALATAKGQSRVIFFARDENGDYRPGAWSYGQPHSGLSAYGQPPPRPVPLAPKLAPLERAYLDSLSCGC